MKKRIGVWIRVSTKLQQNSDSPEHHLQKAKMYAELKEWEIVEEYHLEAVSGKSVISHHEAQRMMRDIQSGHIDALIFSKISRLARNVKELLEFSDHFQKHNADLVSLGESIDTSSPSGRFFYTIISAMSQWERENIVERIKSSVEVRAKMGKVMGGIPFGYKRVGKDDMELDEHEAPIRKMMFDLFLEHKRYATVANILNDKGYRTKRKSLFSGTTVKRLLQDPTAKGIRRSHITKIDENGKTVMRDKEEWYIHEAPRIVSDEVWDEVNAIIQKQEKEKIQPLNKKVHLFTSYLFCECGGGMYVPSSNPKYTCKKCKRKIHIEDIEAIFKEQLTEFIISEDEVNRYFDGTHTIIGDKEQEIENIKNKIETLEVKIAKVFELHEQGKIETERFDEYYNKPNTQIEQLKRKIPEIEGEVYALKDQFKSSGYIIEEARSLYENWDKLTKRQKRNIIEIITEKIVVSEQEVNITLNYILPNSLSLKKTSNGSHGL
ncbi:recombinase family protein [Polaribacter sp. MSW13]|uniref:Recombinase family protein n=1 Tax=Polaribacter marinus TaxID=2916838 RepID=A0A9X1VPC3_9FLAO|nr:recombinase family protein [Polaribacter marinus]MCI2230304.1 recombinase family protein [Polaribacter marinus]